MPAQYQSGLTLNIDHRTQCNNLMNSGGQRQKENHTNSNQPKDRNSVKRVNVQLCSYKKPLLLLDLISSLNKKNIFIASSLDSWVHIFEVQGNSYKVLNSFKTPHIVCQFFYRKDENSLLLGAISGDIYEYSLNRANGLKLRYREQNNIGLPEIIRMYQRGDRLFVLNLEAGLRIVSTKDWSLIGKMEFGVEIACGIWLSYKPSSKDAEQIYCGCIAFHNCQPPILFDCQDIDSFRDTFDTMLKVHQEEEPIQQDHVGHMDQITTMHYMSSLCYLVAGGLNFASPGKHRPYLSFVSVYKIIRYQQTNKVYNELQLQYKVEYKQHINFLSSIEQKLIITFCSEIRVLYVGKREEGTKLNSKNNSLGWCFLVKSNQHQLCVMTARRFNFRILEEDRETIEKSVKDSVGIYIVKHSL